MHGNRTLTTILSLRHPSMIYKALMDAGREFGASALGLRGGAHMEAAQTNVHHTPASRADITRSRSIAYNVNACALPRQEAGRLCPLQRFESALDVQRSGSRVQLCETKRGDAPLDTRAMPKAPRGDFAAVRGRRFYQNPPGLVLQCQIDIKYHAHIEIS